MDGITTITTVDMVQAVRESALLADVTVSVWSAERTDKEATNKIKEDAGATGNVGRMVKNTLAGADEKLKLARSAFAAVRALHYSLTLPWVSDPHAMRQTGPRLLPHALFFRYIGEIGAQKRAAMTMLDEFIADYPDAVTRAQTNLGTLADLTYPTPEEVRSHFRVAYDFEPLPNGAQFRGLPSEATERLSAALESRQRRMAEAAQQAMWQEARERVGHIVDRLSDPETRFKEATIENVKDLLTLLPGWNVAGAPEVDEIVSDIKNMIDGVGVKELRDNLATRSDVVDRARKVIDKLDRWGV